MTNYLKSGGAKMQVAGQVTGYRPHVRLQAQVRSQATGQVTHKNNRTLEKLD